MDQQRLADLENVIRADIFSITKAFTNTLVLRAIERGQFALTSAVSELIPEFSGHGREKVQIWQLLSPQAGASAKKR
jgi:CubicO group peptidase (beta-lactamase class C family)